MAISRRSASGRARGLGLFFFVASDKSYLPLPMGSGGNRTLRKNRGKCNEYLYSERHNSLRQRFAFGLGRKRQRSEPDQENKAHGNTSIPHRLRFIPEYIFRQISEGEWPGSGRKSTHVVA